MWREVLTKLEKRINRPSFNTWIRPTRLLSSIKQQVSIGVPDDVFVYWLGEHYVNVIVDALTETLGFQPNISFVVMEEDGVENDIAAVTETKHEIETRDYSKTSLQKPVERSIPTEVVQSRNHLATVGECALTASALPIPKFQTTTHSSHMNRKSTLRAQGEDILIALAAGRQSSKPPLRSQKASDAKSTLPEATPACAVAASEQQPVAAPPSQARETAAPYLATAVRKGLNPTYTFDSYVVGSNNRLAHAAALAVADQMAANYNPLFIYGGVGLGKTHLLHAVGNHLSRLRPNAKVLYLSSEQFINEMVFSIREDRMTHFRDKYRNIDLLLVDDIQFIARKERTQEEFFHTFNTLYQARKQIVLTSDCPPKKIPTIAEQLRSRFEWGLIADIQAPDLETRIAIIQKKAGLQQMRLPDDVAVFIASKVKSNIRELEGCLSKIGAYSHFTHREISVELAQNVLQDIFDHTPRKVTVEIVQQIVANQYQVELSSMKSSARTRKFTLPRHIAMYLAREMTSLSFLDIGRNFGGRNHTTVMYACRKVKKTQVKDKQLREKIIQLRELIKT